MKSLLNHFPLRAAMLLLVMLLTAATAWAQTVQFPIYSGDEGTEAKPYQIKTKDDLDKLAADVNSGTNYSGKYFVLTDNITYTGGSETVSNYVTIGAHKSSTIITFGGKFDGQGHTISGIRIYKSGTTDENSYQGLFGRISSTAEVKNVILADAIITGYNLTGGIVGVNDGGKVTDCLVLSDVTIRAVKFIAYYHGGIAGHNSGTITGCTSAATLTDNLLDVPSYIYTQEVGGITGYNGGTVNKCFYLGTTLEGNKYVGAIAGYNGGTITYSYFTSTSILGKDENGIELDNANSAVGYNESDGTVTSCGLSDIPWTGSGSEASPYMIYTKDQLDLLAQRVNDGTGYSGKFFKLGANIAYNKSTENNFTPIGTESMPFSGNFDGNGMTISGLNINLSSTNFVGLFGYASGADIKNLILVNSSIVGKDKVGGIAGYAGSNTKVVDCAVTSDVSVTGTYYAGGISGMSGIISGCNSAAAVSASYYAGGIVSFINGNFSNSVDHCIYSGNTVTGSNSGAIVGVNDNNATMTSNYYSSDLAVNGCNGSDINGARQALTISAATGVTITPTGSTTTYSVSGITTYADNSGMGYDGKLYAGATEAVKLSIAYSGTVPEGYTLNYIAIGTISGNATDGYILTMPAADVTVSASVVPDFATYWHADADHDGSTATKAYIITTTTGLNLLAQRVNAGNDYKNKFFKLGDNITYDGTENNFTRIGNNSLYCSFNGTFDGDGKSISGININSGDADYQGIFGLVDGTVKNLVVSNCRIVGRLRVGVIAGVLRCGTIENCRVGNDVTLSGSAFVGGIVGESQGGTIIGCTSAITITGTMVSGNNAYDLGGVVGSAYTYGSYPSSLAGNIFTGTITGKLKDYLGAIVGKNDNGTLTNNYHTSTGFDGIGAADSDKGADGEGARHALTISAADGVTITPTGDATAYSVSSITVYADNTGIKYNNTLYAGATEAVKLTLAYTVPDGYGLSGFTDGNGNVLSKNADGTYTLTMTNVAPTITPTTYVASTLVFEDHGTENNNYNLNLITANDGVTCNVKLNGRTLYKDGKWNTICLPFNVDMTDPDGPLYGATYRTVTEASISGTTLNLTFAEKKSNMDADNTLIAGVPYIIKWNKATDYVDDDAHNIVNPVFAGVKINNVDGTYSNTDESVKFMGTVRALPDVTTWTWPGYDVLLMGGDNTLRYAGSGASLGAFRAYFLVDPAKVGNGGQASARLTSFNIDFGDDNATGIISIDDLTTYDLRFGSDVWYTLDGRKLDGKPTQKGLYIVNGRKVVMK